MMRILFFSALAVLMTAGCSPRVTTDNGNSKPSATGTRTAKVMRNIEQKRVDTRYLDARAKIDLESDDLDIGGTATIRLERDKAIWASVKKFGFEGARVLITPDSFFLVNRLKGEYESGPLSDIERRFKIPARFDLLQDIVLGNAVFFTRELAVDADGNDLLLSGKTREYATRYRIDGSNYRVKQLELDDLGEGRQLVVSNGDFQSVPGIENDFPHRRLISIDGQSAGKAKVEMEFSRLNTEGPFAMPFSKR